MSSRNDYNAHEDEKHLSGSSSRGENTKSHGSEEHHGRGNFGNPEQHADAGRKGADARKDSSGHYRVSEETHAKLSEAGKKGGSHSHKSSK